MFEKDIFDLFLNAPFDWDKKSYKFNRDEKDMHPYSIINHKDKSIIVHNVVGINKKDLKIRIEKEAMNVYIIIEGKSKDEITNKVYSVSSRFAIDYAQLDIKKATSTMNNGLLYITIPFLEPETELKTNTIEIL